MPGPRRVRGARPGGTRALRRVGRTDRGRARRADGPGPQPADRRRHAGRPRIGPAGRPPASTDSEETFLQSAAEDRPCAPGRQRPRPRQLVQRRRHRRDLRQVGQGQRDDLPVGPPAPPPPSATPWPYATRAPAPAAPPPRDPRRPGRPPPGSRRSRSRSAGVKPAPLAHLHQMAPAARAARDPRLVGQFRRWPTAPGRRPAGARSGTRPTSRSVSSGRTTRSSHSSARRQRPRSGRPARCRSRPSRSISTERGGSASTSETRVPGWAARIAASARRHQRGAAAGERDQPDPPRPQPGDRGDLLLGGGQPGEDAGRVPHQRLAGLGQPHLAAGADEQRGAGRRLPAPSSAG